MSINYVNVGGVV